MIRSPVRAPAELASDRVEAQLRRAQRWSLPHTPEGYRFAKRSDEFSIQCDPSPPKRLPRYWMIGILAGLSVNVCALIIMSIFDAPRNGDPQELTMQLVVPRTGRDALLELAFDIRTPLGEEPQWDHLDQAVGSQTTPDVPLAIPSVIDDFDGNPLSVMPTSGGSMIVGGQRGLASRGDGYSGAKIMGVRAKGERFVFVLDNTLPMVGSAWRIARRETLAGVSRLEPGQRFAVVLCGGEIYPKLGSASAHIDELPMDTKVSPDQLHWHVARQGSPSLLAQWLDTRALVQESLSAASLAAALAYHADAIYLIGGMAYPASLAAPIRKRNRWIADDQLKVPGSVIHAIGVGASTLETRGVAEIATENGGHFYHVTAE